MTTYRDKKSELGLYWNLTDLLARLTLLKLHFIHTFVGALD